jgi:hypothetical protein
MEPMRELLYDRVRTVGLINKDCCSMLHYASQLHEIARQQLL